MSNTLGICHLHQAPQQVIVRADQGPTTVCQQCYKLNYPNSLHIVLNTQAKLFFTEWTQSIIQHYNSVLNSYMTNEPLPVFHFSDNALRKTTQSQRRSCIEQLLRNEIDIHHGNISFVKNTSNLCDLTNPFFMNDLLNFFNQSVTGNLTCLLPVIEADLNKKGLVLSPGQITLDPNIIKSLEEYKFNIKQKYGNTIQLANTQQLPDTLKDAILNEPTSNQPKTDHKVNKTQQQKITPRREPKIDQDTSNLKTLKKNHQEASHMQQEMTDFIQITGSHRANELQLIIERLEEENNHLREWKNQIEHYLDQMSMKIEELTPKEINIDTQIRVIDNKNSQFAMIQHLSEKLRNIQEVVHRQKQRNEQLTNHNNQLLQQLEQSKSKINEQSDQVIDLQNQLGYQIQDVQRLFIKQIQELNQNNDKLTEDKNKAINQQNLQKIEIEQLKKQRERISWEHEDLQQQNNMLRIKIDELKEELAKKSQTPILQNVSNSSDQQSQDSQKVSNLAEQIKQKMNKINSLIKTSSMPQLRKSSNKKNKHKHINEIQAKNPPSIKNKKNNENLFENLAYQINQKNVEISKLNQINNQMKIASQQLNRKLQQLQSNSHMWVQDLQSKIKENQQEIESVTKEKAMHEQEMLILKKEIEQIITIKNSMESSLENKELIIRKLNCKIQQLEKQLAVKPNSHNQQINQQLLEQVIIYEAEIQRKKQHMSKLIALCRKVIGQLEQQKFGEFHAEISTLEKIIRAES